MKAKTEIAHEVRFSNVVFFKGEVIFQLTVSEFMCNQKN